MKGILVSSIGDMTAGCRASADGMTADGRHHSWTGSARVECSARRGRSEPLFAIRPPRPRPMDGLPPQTDTGVSRRGMG